MGTEKSVSFRAHLVGNATDLIEEIGLQCARTAKLIAAVVSQLAAYSEEGTPLTPTVFICNSVSELLQRAGAGEHVPLSGDEQTESAGTKALKAAAPLCNDNWRIYIERIDGGASCRYGVFCGTRDPSSLTVDEVVLDGFENGFPIIKISQSAKNKVEVRTNAGSGIEFRFNDDMDVYELNSRGRIHALANAAASGVAEQSELFARFLERLLSSAIRECHGTLVAVAPASYTVLPASLQDAVRFEPPLDLFGRLQLHIDEGKTSESVNRLQAAAELVAGFIRSDGITVFNEGGKVLGYRAFIHREAKNPPSTGGARTRAFNALVDLVNEGELVAAFFRSHDGRTEFQTRAEAEPR
jgi:hypothetical protein